MGGKRNFRGAPKSNVAGIKNVDRVMNDPRALPLPAVISRRLDKGVSCYLS
jgi:hypothetical protein